MLQAFATLITVELVGLVTFPLVARAFPALADRGWAIAKPLGMLTVATIVWLGSYSQVIPNDPAMWWGVAALLTLGSLWVLRTEWNQLRRILARRWRFVITTELLFLAFFLLFLTLRAFDPAASGTEKPMDLMMLNAVTATQFAPPQDLWLSGEPIAYYYFGYWIYGGINAMAGTEPSVAYNVGIALVGGLAASVMGSLVATFVRRDGASAKISLVTGTVSATVLLVGSNLSGLWTLLDVTRIAPNGLLNWYHGHQYDRIDKIATWRPDDFWWWWRGSRIANSFDADGNQLDFTIQEFPFFSFLLGDFHPHLMSIPFVLTGITVLAALFIAHKTLSLRTLRKNLLAGGFLALVLGSSGFINFWDVGLLLLLSIGFVVAGWVSSRQGSIKSLFESSVPLVVIWFAGVLIYSPFYFGTAESQVQWPPIAPVKYGTRPIHFLSIWLPLVLIAAPMIAILTKRYVLELVSVPRSTANTVRPSYHLLWRPAWIVAVELTAIPFLIWAITNLVFNDQAQASDFFTRLPVSGSLALIAALCIAVTLTRARRGADDGAQFVLTLFSLATYLLFAAEVFFVHDLFGNRMNTVFKFYYQAWILLSVAGGYGIFLWWKHHPQLTSKWRVASRTVVGIAAVVAVTSAYFGAASAVTKTVSSGLGPDLDGLSFLEERHPDELQVIVEIKSIRTKDDVLAEAVGGSYTDFGRIAGSSGVPTVIGWTFHQTQWHGSNELFDDREDDVETLYTSDDEQEIRDLIEKYALTLLVVGPRERSTYGNTSMRMFDTLGDRIIEHGNYTVFRVGQ